MDCEMQKNCLIVGTFECYCLLCEKVLTSKSSISVHIQSHTHSNNLKSNTYLEKYKEDSIRQVGRGYHCEFCNVLLVTKPKVTHHINEDTHKHSRGMFLLKEVKNGVLAFNKVFIVNKAWHGLIDETCVICDADIKDADQHIQEITHIFKLIQIKLEFNGDNIFRMVDRDFYNCLTCNLILHVETLTTHFQNGSHERQYTVCRDLYTCYINDENASQNTNSITNLESIDGCNITTMNSEHKAETAVGELIDINTEMPQENKETPEQKKTSPMKLEELEDGNGRKEYKTADETEKKVEAHESGTAENETNKIDSELDQAKIYEPQEAFQMAKIFAKKNGIKYKHGSHNAYCYSCDVKVSSSLKRMRDHVSLPAHQKNQSEYIQRVPMYLFTKHTAFKTIMDIPSLIINNNILIKLSHYHMLTENNDNVRCLLCEVNINPQSIIFHMKLHAHMMETTVKVLVKGKFDEEFVREIRPNLFHCGYCSILSEGLEELESHLISLSHKKEKNANTFVLNCLLLNA